MKACINFVCEINLDLSGKHEEAVEKYINTNFKFLMLKSFSSEKKEDFLQINIHSNLLEILSAFNSKFQIQYQETKNSQNSKTHDIGKNENFKKSLIITQSNSYEIKYKDLLLQYEKCRSENETLQVKCERQSNEIALNSKLLKEYHTFELSTDESKIKTPNDKIKHLETLLKNIKLEKEKEVGDLKENITKLKLKIVEVEDENAKITVQKNELETQLKIKENEVKNYTIEKEFLISKVKKLKVNHTKCKNLLEWLNYENKSLKDQIPKIYEEENKKSVEIQEKIKVEMEKKYVNEIEINEKQKLLLENAESKLSVVSKQLENYKMESATKKEEKSTLESLNGNVVEEKQKTVCEISNKNSSQTPAKSSKSNNERINKTNQNFENLVSIKQEEIDTLKEQLEGIIKVNIDLTSKLNSYKKIYKEKE